ncbi:MAG: phenylacetic acid degradation operon negative regulatory protein PaaX [Zoogloeaceae bacterium]|jgi:phenylacetic acid degradation operon negative regulatory protein|nr:phenylacetic acid degradation operon negative regulatory protein PaaX [Zoogloeaceae bacterium]
MKTNRFVSQWVEEFLRENPVRANSLIITVYGDAIAPHGGSVWLGSVIRLVKPLGINDRLVRTSVFRLSKDSWLTSEHIGRCSYYGLTATGKRRFEHAYRRIYSQSRTRWKGDWQIVLIRGGDLPSTQRDEVRKELLWEGFGVIAPGVLAHPSSDFAPLLDILQSNGVQDSIVVLHAQNLGALVNKPARDLVRECWSLDLIAQDYKRFLDHFRPVLKALKSARELDPEQCFVVRTLLMHEFRRTLLRDPQLPDQLLPGDWPGNAARQLCRDLYVLTQKAAETHLMSVLETASGHLPEAAPYFYERFGGLHTASAAA